jgi:hypothetical protein
MVIGELAEIGFANMADYMKTTPGGDRQQCGSPTDLAPVRVENVIFEAQQQFITHAASSARGRVREISALYGLKNQDGLNSISMPSQSCPVRRVVFARRKILAAVVPRRERIATLKARMGAAGTADPGIRSLG